MGEWPTWTSTLYLFIFLFIYIYHHLSHTKHHPLSVPARCKGCVSWEQPTLRSWIPCSTHYKESQTQYKKNSIDYLIRFCDTFINSQVMCSIGLKIFKVFLLQNLKENLFFPIMEPFSHKKSILQYLSCSPNIECKKITFVTIPHTNLGMFFDNTHEINNVLIMLIKILNTKMTLLP